MPAVEPYLKSAGWAGSGRKEYRVQTRPMGTVGRRSRRIIAAVLCAAAAAVAAAYAAIPRRADLTAFDPAEMARLETAMWRHYYEQRYLALFLDLYEVARREQGFSPLDSVRIALAAAGAARSFQPSTSRAQAEAAIPDLVAYFRLLARAAPVAVDGQEAARTELAWWQARRETVSAEQYGAIIARVSTLLYGVDNEDIRQSGLLRAQAMDYRDAHSADMTEADWAAIEGRLRSAYGLLKKAASSPAR
jgi:ABC-type amino acid transport substrate-binding protein